MTRNSIEVQRARKVKEPDSHYIGLIGQLNGLIHTRVNEDSWEFSQSSSSLFSKKQTSVTFKQQKEKTTKLPWKVDKWWRLWDSLISLPFYFPPPLVTQLLSGEPYVYGTDLFPDSRRRRVVLLRRRLSPRRLTGLGQTEPSRLARRTSMRGILML